MPGITPTAEQTAALTALKAAHDELSRELETTKRERDEYRRLYLALLEAYRKLEAGLIGQKRERFVGGDEQLALALLSMLTQGTAPTSEGTPDQTQVEKVEAHERRKPTGRKPLPEHLPRVQVEVIPPEVQRQGLDAFERLGEDVSEIVEHRPSSFVVVRTVRPKFVPKAKREEVAAETPPVAPAAEVVASTPVSQAPGPEWAAMTIPAPQSEPVGSTPVSQAPAPELAMKAIPSNRPQSEPVASTPVSQAPAPELAMTIPPNAPQSEAASSTPVPQGPALEMAAMAIPPGAPQSEAAASMRVLQAPALELPIPRSLCGPGLLADTIVRRWQDHLPLHRLERVYGRQGLELPRSTVGGWHASTALLLKALIDAMWKDALSNSPYICTDATGVLVQALEKCRRAHFFVVIAPKKHVLFGYSPKHDSAAVDKLLAEYKGFLVADAHAVYDHLYRTGDVVEVGCWAHARRYWFKSLDTDGTRARHGLSLIQALFKLEREYATAPPEEKLRRRQQDAKPAVEAFFRYCDEEAAKVVDETPIAKAIGYARNQRVALSRFLEDGRLPIHNNHSENALRREALGRKNWLFLGSDDGGTVNATFVTLLASCQLHDLEPLSYLRDLLCLLPGWPIQHVLELAPANWRATIERPEVRAQLDANIFRQVVLGVLKPAATE